MSVSSKINSGSLFQRCVFHASRITSRVGGNTDRDLASVSSLVSAPREKKQQEDKELRASFPHDSIYILRGNRE